MLYSTYATLILLLTIIQFSFLTATLTETTLAAWLETHITPHLSLKPEGVRGKYIEQLNQALIEFHTYTDNKNFYQYTRMQYMGITQALKQEVQPGALRQCFKTLASVHSKAYTCTDVSVRIEQPRIAYIATLMETYLETKLESEINESFLDYLGQRYALLLTSIDEIRKIIPDSETENNCYLLPAHADFIIPCIAVIFHFLKNNNVLTANRFMNTIYWYDSELTDWRKKPVLGTPLLETITRVWCQAKNTEAVRLEPEKIPAHTPS